MNPLRALHERLDVHFEQLRGGRQGSGAPLFALEHGLPDADLLDLKIEVRAALKSARSMPQWWLPIVVYSAEIGYKFTGEEYWPTFQAETPGWAENGDLHYIRERFLDFSSRYAGARPAGTWADQFSIISWPITHAVIPTDLQSHLARLLYDFRHRLTPDVLASPDDLGSLLAAGANGMSSRFEQFAQNTYLLGQVAAALLLGTEGESPLLLGSTLARIVRDLSVHRQARLWLSDAKLSASRIEFKGFSRGGTGARVGGDPLQPARRRATTSVGLSLARSPEGTWEPYLVVPDTSWLGERRRELEPVLDACRCRVEGSEVLLPLGQLLYPGKRVKLTRWPRVREALFRTEPGNKDVDALLADHFYLLEGPWLFEQSDEGLATYVRTKTVRPGRGYVVVVPEGHEAAPESGPAQGRQLGCAGAVGLRLHIPSPVDDEALRTAGALGLSVATTIEIAPAGVVPAKWDGGGVGEWVAGDDPLVVVSSTQAISTFAVSVDDQKPFTGSWPGGPDSGLFLLIPQLSVGDHELRVMVAPPGVDPTVLEGRFLISIRPAEIRSTAGTYQEPIMIECVPVAPTLAEIWQGSASLQIVGPVGLRSAIKLRLEDAKGTVLASKDLQLSLPVSDDGWAKAFRDQFLSMKQAERLYDDAARCIIEVSFPLLGTATLECARPFRPLRWAIGSDQAGTFARLYDNLGDSALVIESFAFGRPTDRIPATLEAGGRLRVPAGGLLSAQAARAEAAVVVPPRIRTVQELSLAKVTPTFGPAARSVEVLRDWTRRAYVWGNADLPGNPIAAILRTQVLRGFAQAVSGLVGGRTWRLADRVFDDEGSRTLSALTSALGQSPSEKYLADDFRRRLSDHGDLATEGWVEFFAEELRIGFGDLGGDGAQLMWVAESLLRLASEPGSVVRWAGSRLDEVIEFPLRVPLALRLARYLVRFRETSPGDTAASDKDLWAWL